MTKRPNTDPTKLALSYRVRTDLTGRETNKDIRKRTNGLLAEIVKEGMAPPLKAAGFRKSGLVFRRAPAPALTHIVEVQKRRWVDPDETSFSIECGVYPAGYVAFFGGPEPRAPRTPHGPLRTRIGTLTNDDYEKFWDFRATLRPKQRGEIADDIRWRIAGPVLDWLAQFPTVRAVADYLVVAEPGPGRTRMSYWDPPQDYQDCANAALCYAFLGDDDRARHWTEQADKGAKNPAARARVADFRERLERFIAGGAKSGGD